MNVINRINLHFTSATITATIAAAIAVAVSFGAHLSQAQTHSILTLVGILTAAVTIGGGVKTGGMIKAGVARASSFHFTSATIVSAIGAAIAVAVAFGLHLTPENKTSLLTLVGLLAGGITIGGSVKSAAMLRAGVHPLQTAAMAPTMISEARAAAGLGDFKMEGNVFGLEPTEGRELRTDPAGEPAPFRPERTPRRKRYDEDVHPALRTYGTFKGLALGKHLQVKTDPRTPILGEFLTAEAPKAKPSLGFRMPATVERIPEVSAEVGGDFGMMGNDVYGDCTCAALGHGLQFWTGYEGTVHTATTAEVLALYWATGTPPTPGADDNGRVMFEVLKYAHANGLFGHELGAYVGVGLRRWHNRDVKAAIDLFGGCYLGVALPETAQTQPVWDVAGDPTKPGPAQAGSWGGHAIWVPDYDRQGLDCITWGHPHKMTWGFLDSYADEGYVIISPDWLRGGKTIQGFDLAALDAYLAKIKSWQPPGS